MFRFKEIKETGREVERHFNNINCHNGYRQIKPKTTMTVEQAKDFIDSLFSNVVKED